MENLKIHPELESLFPPLSDEEYAGLEKDIVENGLRNPIVTWNRYIVDGHHRYKICQKHGLEYQTRPITFKSLDDVKLWAFNEQVNRRNLSPFVKARLALRMRPIIEAAAKRNMRVGCLGHHINTREVLGKMADMTGRTFDKAVYISQYADEETKQRLERGDKGVSISGIYNSLTQKNSKKKTAVQNRHETDTFGERFLQEDEDQYSFDEDSRVIFDSKKFSESIDYRHDFFHSILNFILNREGVRNTETLLLDAIRSIC